MWRPNSSAIRCSSAAADDGEPAPERATAAPKRRQRRADGRRDLERQRHASRTGDANDGARRRPRSTTPVPDDAEPVPRARPPTRPAAIRNGPASAPAAATTATTISKPSSPPRPRWRIGCASNLRSAIADPARRMIGQYLIDLVDEAGYLERRSCGGRRKSSAPASPKSRPCSASCKPSIRRACARAISPNAWRSSSRSAIASIRRCRRWSRVSICWRGAILPR